MLSLQTSLFLVQSAGTGSSFLSIIVLTVTTANTMHFYKLVYTISLLWGAIGNRAISKDDRSPSGDVDLSIYNLIESLTRYNIHFIHRLFIH